MIQQNNNPEIPPEKIPDLEPGPAKHHFQIDEHPIRPAIPPRRRNTVYFRAHQKQFYRPRLHVLVVSLHFQSTSLILLFKFLFLPLIKQDNKINIKKSLTWIIQDSMDIFKKKFSN